MNLLVRARLAGEILGDYVKVRRQLRHYSLPALVCELRSCAPERGRCSADPHYGPRLARAVVRTLEPLPVDSRCLMRSLVLLRVLARRGVTGELVIAVRPGAPDRLGAHAWVEIAGQPVLAPAGADHGRLVTL